nr:Chain A, TRANSDUCIN ALPHA-1 SUBUNIT [Bos taurus]
IKENLKDCGLF